MFLLSCISRVVKEALVTDREALFAPVILVLVLTVASLGPVSTFVCLLVLLPCLSLSADQIYPNLKYTNFYASWATTSFVILVGVFELEVVPFLEILVYENALVVLLTLITLLLTIVVRVKSGRDSSQQSGGRGLEPRVFRHTYCPWIKSVISSDNRIFFIFGLLSGTAALVYGSQLMLTTICHPSLFFEYILLPDDCSDVYSDPQ